MEIEQIRKMVLAIVVLLAVVGIIIFLFKGKGGDALASIGRALRFG